MANKEYSSSDIQTLRFPDSLRMNPGVYIGAVDSDGYWLVVRECLDNGLDEFLAGYLHLFHDFIPLGRFFCIAARHDSWYEI